MKKITKKIFFLLTMIIFAFSLSGCSSDEDELKKAANMKIEDVKFDKPELKREHTVFGDAVIYIEPKPGKDYYLKSGIIIGSVFKHDGKYYYRDFSKQIYKSPTSDKNNSNSYVSLYSGGYDFVNLKMLNRNGWGKNYIEGVMKNEGQTAKQKKDRILEHLQYRALEKYALDYTLELQKKEGLGQVSPNMGLSASSMLANFTVSEFEVRKLSSYDSSIKVDLYTLSNSLDSRKLDQMDIYLINEKHDEKYSIDYTDSAFRIAKVTASDKEIEKELKAKIGRVYRWEDNQRFFNVYKQVVAKRKQMLEQNPNAAYKLYREYPNLILDPNAPAENTNTVTNNKKTYVDEHTYYVRPSNTNHVTVTMLKGNIVEEYGMNMEQDGFVVVSVKSNVPSRTAELQKEVNVKQYYKDNPRTAKVAKSMGIIK